MITKEEAREIAINWLIKRKIDFNRALPVDKVQFSNNKFYLKDTIGEYRDVYDVHFVMSWGTEECSLFVSVDVNTGQPLRALGPHGSI